MFAYRWRINGGPWSADLPIGDGFDPDNGTVRTGEIQLSGLVDGDYTVEVLGQTFAGVWQEEPTISETWTVSASLPGSVRLNEIIAAGGGSGDAVELFNPGTSSISLAGMSLSDDPSDTQKFIFPAGVSLQAGDYLVLTVAEFGFNLNRAGETLSLYDASGALVDTVTFGSQIEDHSLSRIGHDAAWGLGEQTLGSENVAARTGNPATLRISEWFANGQIAFEDDFVEIFNPDPLPVALAGLYLSDNANSDPARYQIPPLTFVSAGGYVSFDSGQLGFNLSATMDALSLFNAEVEELDRIVFGQQAEDFAQLSDGSFQGLPTPGLPTGGSAEYDRVLAIYDALRITEIMFNPADDEALEFIELQNTGAIPINLGGLRFSDGIDFTFPGMTLAPGAFVVVASDLDAFRTRYGSNINVVGPYSGQLSNGGEEILLQLPDPYDAGILRFEYDDAWVAAADGGGSSLELVEPARAPR